VALVANEHLSSLADDAHALTSQQPIRVVLFGGGPQLEPAVKQFIVRLHEHTQIHFLGAFCQSEAHTFVAAARDLWRRRRFLALPLLFVKVAEDVARFASQPVVQRKLNQKVARLANCVHLVADIHSQHVLERVRALEPDLGLIYGSPVLKPALFQIPRYGTLGIHHGKVPQYRGKKTTFWAMYHGETTAGVTIQKVNAGLDTGAIVKEGSVPIGSRSYRAVWRDLEALGLDLYLEAILEVKEGNATYHAQSGPKGKVYRDPKIGDLWRFWWRHLARRFKLTGRAGRY
jgi:folate-dependent phosphoribosylglycinamide formyltransferase PurN